MEVPSKPGTSGLVLKLAEQLPEQDMELTEALGKAMKDITGKIGEINPQFKCSVIPAGSAVEGTQVDTSDFDYIISLDYFGRDGICQLRTEYCENGQAMLKLSGTDDIIAWKENTRTINGLSFLTAATLKYKVHDLFKAAASGTNLHPRLHFIPDYKTYTYGPAIKLMASPSSVLSFTWDNDKPGVEQCQLIDVDLVIGIYIGQLNSGLAEHLGMDRSYRTQKMTQLIENITKCDFYAVGRFDYKWRVSWGQAEMAFMKYIGQTTPNAILCYKVLKYICKSHFTHDGRLVSLADSYVLKNILFDIWINIDGDPYKWVDDHIGDRFMQMIQQFKNAYFRGLRCTLASRVEVLKPSEWHTYQAVPALDAFIGQLLSNEKNIWTDEQLGLFLKDRILCKPR